ncbi:TraR/DksA family transcriptional regulator [Sulfuriroseicoccus oceanibius]|uniref:TraR/DksA C4-type zinc finger protein n=1 Tax=Sulfuriroseicoccus oceanibius TaxID=2707525 RepID=A0A6B3LBN8_9BACT|nr:TraR/DksA C4-type zinc finger protein [Sulfuriroseicoccus oceanibius]QQL44672.1 TraR/DksA C4-type zinc finger protein [Sulfuriroseicoccus oceanibius]
MANKNPEDKAVAKKAAAKKKKVAVSSEKKTTADKATKTNGAAQKSPFKAPFLKAQRQRLADLRDVLVDAMNGVQRDNLRNSTEGGSAFGQHQADAGSDAYDRDFALNMLSQEQDSLYEIDEAIGRLERGVYGICEMSGQAIPEERLVAIPFARLTVECQSQLERESALNGNGGRGVVYGGSAPQETFERILED